MGMASHALVCTDTLWFPLPWGVACGCDCGCSCGATATVASEACSRSSRSPALTSASVITPNDTIAVMATADERELQINPIVASSVQHNTQVRLRPRPRPRPRLRLHPPQPPPGPLPTICSPPRLARSPRASSIMTTAGHVQHP